MHFSDVVHRIYSHEPHHGWDMFRHIEKQAHREMAMSKQPKKEQIDLEPLGTVAKILHVYIKTKWHKHNNDIKASNCHGV